MVCYYFKFKSLSDKSILTAWRNLYGGCKIAINTIPKVFVSVSRFYFS